MSFKSFSMFVVASLALIPAAVLGSPAGEAAAGSAVSSIYEPGTALNTTSTRSRTPSSAKTNSHWLATTNATLTFIGDPIPTDGSPSRRASTMVTYCNTRSGGVCGGRCTVYNDGAACLNAPGTQCLFATNNVAFGSHGGCGWTCKRLDECGVRLDGFCYTPGTQSILVGAA